MDQVQSVEILNGKLALNEETLRAAQIVGKARIILQNRAILILPETDQVNDPVNSTFGMIQLPADVAKEIAESKELEYEL